MLPAVIIILLFLLIVVPVLVKWTQQDSKASVKDQKTSAAFSLAEAAVDRGNWKVKSSTATFAQVMAGSILAGYNFDVTYADIPGGSYRIKVASGPDIGQVTIYGEGRSAGNNETRAIKAVYTNTSVPGAILAGANLKTDKDSVVHWGPVMAKGDITVATQSAVNTHFPRKLAMGVVKPFDTTTDPPNFSIPREKSEWESNYPVPDMPVFDFEAIRASAAATGTLNCTDVTTTSTTYTSESGFVGSGCSDTGANCACSGSPRRCLGSGCADNCSCSGSGSSKVCTGSGCRDPGSSCTCYTGPPRHCDGSGCGDCVPITVITTTTVSTTTMHCCTSSSTYYGGPVTCDYTSPPVAAIPCVNCEIHDMFHYASLRDQDYTWYWDNNVTWTGYIGVRGTVVVKGDMKIDTGGGDDRYCRGPNDSDNVNPIAAPYGCTVNVPPQAYEEYRSFDTTASNEYPGDTGLRSNAATYKLDNSSTMYGLGSDLGVYGFLYVNGTLDRKGVADIYGAIWVVGNSTGTGNSMVIYNSKLKVPTINVVLVNNSWEELKPSTQAWP